MNTDLDFLCFRRAYDITGVDDFSRHATFGDVHMPMWWATVMWFNRSKHSQLIFDTMVMIKNHWDHYRKIYKINQPTYRNDYAVSIALCLVNGHTLSMPSIPWGLASLTPEHELLQLDTDEYKINFTTADLQPRWIKLKNQDFHAMGKQQLEKVIASNT
jgi:hypothetical protein